MDGGDARRDRARAGLVGLNIYGLSEIVGPGVAAECGEGRDGSHVNEDHFLAEVVDPETGEPLPTGAEGELVFTHADQGGAAPAALPHGRYRRRWTAQPCPCGRTLARMARCAAAATTC